MSSVIKSVFIRVITFVAVYVVILFGMATVLVAQPVLGPGLQDALSAAAPTERLQVIVSFHGDGPISTTQKLALTSLGLKGVYMKALPIAGVLATPSQVQKLLRRSDVRSVWLNAQLQYENDGATAITGVDRLRTTNELRNDMGLPFTGKGVGVLVNDSGIDGLHPDLQFGRNLKQNVLGQLNLNSLSAMLPITWVENVPNTDIGGGHGTHVAGTIGGTGQQSAGLHEGVAPGADLLGYGSGAAILILDTIGAFDWALVNQARYGIRIVSNSWGNTGDSGTPFNPDDPTNIATKALADRGIVVVFSAGNSGAGEGTITGNFKKAPWVVCVAAGDKSGNLADFSSRGMLGNGGTVQYGNQTLTWVDRPTVTAPGVDIISARASTSALQALSAQQDAALSPAHLPFYTHMSGTSMAAPHVAGIIALMLEANPSLDAYDVKRILEHTATNIPGRAGWEAGAGYVNAYNAVRMALEERTDFGTTVNLLRTFNANVQVAAGGSQPFSFDFSPVGETGSQTFYVGPDVARVTATANMSYETTVALVLVDPAGNRYGSSIALPLLGSTVVASAPGMEGTWTVTAGGIGAVSGLALDPLGLTNGFSGPGAISGLIYFTTGVGTEGLNDISGHAARQDIEYAVARRLVDSFSDGTYRPDALLKMGDYIEYLVMGMGVRQELPLGGGYSHGVSGHRAPFVEAALARGAALRDTYQQYDGVVYLNGGLNLNAAVTRADLAYSFVQSLGWQEVARGYSGELTVDFNGERLPLEDAALIPTALRGYVQLALDLNILNAFFSLEQGTYDLQPVIKARFQSDRAVTRAEYAIFAARFVDNYLGGVSGVTYSGGTEATLTAPLTASAEAPAMAASEAALEAEATSDLPAEFDLAQNYPNPVSEAGRTTIAYALPRPSEVSLEVYDIQGRLVATLVSGQQEAGRYEVVWNGRSESGEPIASGLYLYRLQAGDFTATKKLTLIK